MIHVSLTNPKYALLTRKATDMIKRLVAGSKVYNDRGWDTAPEVEDYDVFAGYGGYSGFRHSSANTSEEQVDDEVA
jgi:hypothetical protein